MTITIEADVVAAGLAITDHFLQRFVFAPLGRPRPSARPWLSDRLAEARRL
jgi:DNA repair protein RecO (recombination protein O)